MIAWVLLTKFYKKLGKHTIYFFVNYKMYVLFMKRRRVIDVIRYNPNTLNRVTGMTIQNRSKMYNEMNKINTDELSRSDDENFNVEIAESTTAVSLENRIELEDFGVKLCIKEEATAFVSQFREREISVHCILKQETRKCRIEKDSAFLDIPKNIIQEKRASLIEAHKKKENKMEAHVGKIKRSSYLAYLASY